MLNANQAKNCLPSQTSKTKSKSLSVQSPTSVTPTTSPSIKRSQLICTLIRRFFVCCSPNKGRGGGECHNAGNVTFGDWTVARRSPTPSTLR
ncbi:hypothetical protein CEXT_764531 [Caerostris extrusa]|uniref:Uncharacterized protein n=1 Tax=Caerostris extrusa TaxID=172846 RepID=A0AAV4SXT6_CAEEX|nr:hypothetical protein CEXT_764531 [Caerostris extrusa]